MKIGFIGLGIMGESMCENIVKKHDDTVYCSDVNFAQAEKLAAKGAVACKTNVEVAENADLIITMVPNSAIVKTVYEGLLPVLHKGQICIDMSTIDPDVSVGVANKVKEKGVRFADAPVVKSKPAAIAGTLGILVGCEEDLYGVIEPVLSYMGAKVIRMGGNGAGLVMKICHNTLVGQIQNGVNETLNLAVKLGLDPDDFYAACAAGGAQCFYLDGQHENLKNENWITAFSFANMNKDVHICQRMAAEAGFAMPGMENVVRVYEKGMAAGIGNEDFRASYKVVRGDLDA